MCNLGDECAGLLPMIVEIIVTTYSNTPNHCILELAKQVRLIPLLIFFLLSPRINRCDFFQLLILFGNMSDFSLLMSGMLKELCVFTLTTFESTKPENLSEHTCLFEHFYTFCTNILKKNCKLMLKTEGVNLVLLFRYGKFD